MASLCVVSLNWPEAQDNRPSPEIPTREPCKFVGSHTSLRVAQGNVEGSAVCSKNSTFGYFDGTAWTPHLRSSPPITAPDKK